MAGKTKIYSLLKKSRASNVPQNIVITEEVAEEGSKKKQKKRRIIRYVDSMDTIYVDEQDKIDEKAKQTNKAFIRGLLKVDPDDHVLIKYLEKLPMNKANGGDLFKELIIDEEEKYEIEKFKRITDAQSILTKADEKLIRAIGIEFIGQSAIGLTTTKIMMKIRPLIEQDKLDQATGKSFIDRFTKFSKSKDIDEKLMLSMALQEGVLKIHNGKSIKWGIDGEETIFTGTQAGSVLDEVASWFKIDKEGQTTLAAIAKKIK
tara:strand:+ start:4275 stop:5057 length:783 start_codon:yes stop_codon:yes gene_type:complete